MRQFLTILRVAIPLILFVLIVVFLWKGLKRDPHRLPSPLIGKAVPTFNASRLLHPQQTISNDDLKGKVTLLNVFATWCYSCRAEHPVLMDIKSTHRVNIVGLNFKDKRPAARQWLTQFGDPYSEVIFDPTGHIGVNFGVYGTPETFLIDRHGIIRDKYIGPISPTEWTDKILPEVKRLQRG